MNQALNFGQRQNNEGSQAGACPVVGSTPILPSPES